MIAPIVCKEIDSCIFVTDISRMTPDSSDETSAQLQKVLQSVFGMLIGDKRAIIIDVSDFLAGTKIEDVIQSIIDDVNEAKQAETEVSSEKAAS